MKASSNPAHLPDLGRGSIHRARPLTPPSPQRGEGAHNRPTGSGLRAVVVTHVTISPSGGEVYGQCHAIADFLRETAGSLLFIRQSLTGRHHLRAELTDRASVRPFQPGTTPPASSQHTLPAGGKVQGEGESNGACVTRVGERAPVQLPWIPTLPRFPFGYAGDLLSVILRVLRSPGRYGVFIGVDSLNALAGIILRKLGQVRRVIFYTADYVPRRFENPVMNWLYHFADRRALAGADLVWNISMAQVRIRRAQGVPERKNLHVPHGADIRKIPFYETSKIDRMRLVLVANLSRAFALDVMIEGFARLVRQVPEATLSIIGSGEKEAETRRGVKRLGLSDRVEMRGWLPHDEAIGICARSGIGVALYTSACSWTRYSDSFKVKEYLACGLPVIISGADSAIEETAPSGAILPISPSPGEFAEIALKLLRDERLHDTLRRRARTFAETLDWHLTYTRALSSLIAGHELRSTR